MDLVATLTRESDRFATILAALAPGTPCPTRPGWRARDLIAHLTEVQSFWAAVLSHDLRTDADIRVLEEHPPAFPESIDEVLPIRAAATRALTASLGHLEDAAPRWTGWSPDQTVGFIRRMQLCNAVMCRVDAELAAGLDPAPLGPPVAVTCLNQRIDVIWASRPAGPGEAAFATADDSFTTAELRAGGYVWHVDVARNARRKGEASVVDTRPRGTQSGAARSRVARPAPGAVPTRATWARRAGPGAAPSVHVTGGLDDLARWAWGRGGDVTVIGAPAGVEAVKDLAATSAAWAEGSGLRAERVG